MIFAMFLESLEMFVTGLDDVRGLSSHVHESQRRLVGGQQLLQIAD